MGDTLDEVRRLVSDVTEVPFEKLTPDADFFSDLNIDSLKAIEIVAAFEKKYKVVIPENEIPNIRTIKDIMHYLNKI